MAKDIGGRLQAAFGNRWGREVHVEGYVLYQVDLPWPIDGGLGLQTMPFVKLCGKTFEEQAAVLWASNSGAGGGGGMCGPGAGGSIGGSPEWGVVG